MGTMSEGYDELLAATIQHLEGLKSRGTKFVTVSPETLSALAQAPERPMVKASAAPLATAQHRSNARTCRVSWPWQIY